MAPFGDGGVGCGDGGEALRGWDPLRSGSAPPTMEGAAAAAAAAERRVFGGGGDGASFFSGIDGLMFGARMDEVSRCRGAAGAQEHFGNSTSLSVGPSGQLFNGAGDWDEWQFGPSTVHSGGAMANYAFDMNLLWTDMNPDNAEYHRNIQNHFMSNIENMNAYGNRDLDASSMFDSDISDALSGLRLSNNSVMDQRNNREELADEILERQRDFSKTVDETRSSLVGNVFHAPRSDVHPSRIYGDGILRRQTSACALDGSNVSRINRHHIKGVDRPSLADQLAIMQSGNFPRGTNLSRNVSVTNMSNPMSNRYNSNTDLDLARSRMTFFKEILAQQYLQEDNLSYNDSRIYHDEPCFPCSRMQRSGSHFYSNSRCILSHGDRQSRLLSLNRKAMGRNIGSHAYHDNTLSNYLDVLSLDNADRNGADSVELIDLVGHVKEISMDQYGSRFIQQKLEIASLDDREKIFPEILSNAIALTTDVFGNYVIQKFFEFATERQLIQLADQLKGHILELSLQMYGCRVVQKVLEVVDKDRKIDIVHELRNHILKCIGDQNGNHVIQKCIECVPEDRIPFVIDPILSQILVLCTHQYGCRVIQRVLEHCHDPVTQSATMNEIVQQTFHLTDDKFGNYVVQHVLKHGKPEERSAIIQKLSGQVVILSKLKYASNVIEKCLEFGTLEERDSLIGEIISSGQTFQELMKDQFGNYVVQKVLKTCDERYLEMILSSIKLHLNELKNYTYGKHIVTRVEKLIVTGEERARMASLSGQRQQQPPNCTAVDAH
ncbi:uncharacterized protein LOC100383330 [Zea mays]|uniref:Pumilio homolog 3 n=1 Tax=Zea mays TaxID=4577 RepID=A0A1D6J493_MAIZE|nr:uncharacterized protein LOC100383330 [Zea mays]AQK42803.1 Pumilio homolog 3 [Zea mays]|eukprot:XP_008662192.1 uncharacterized protein LOC100383330 isoform X1 [Zea mays]